MATAASRPSPVPAPVREPRGDGGAPRRRPHRHQATEAAARSRRRGRRTPRARRASALGARATARRASGPSRHAELARRDSDGEARGRRRVDDERAGLCRRPRRKLGRPAPRQRRLWRARRRTVRVRALRTLPQASSTGTTTRPTTFVAKKSGVCAAPASMISKERHRSTYAIILPNRFSCKGVQRKWFCGHSVIEAAPPRRPRALGPPKNARPSASAPSSSLRCAATRSRHASASLPSQTRPKIRVPGREGPFWQILDEVRPRMQGPHDMSVDVLPR